MERFETRLDRMARMLAELNGHKFERNGAAKKCNRLQKPKSHRQLILRVAKAAGVLYGLPRLTVSQVMNAFLRGLRDDLVLGDSFTLRGVGILSSDVRESKPRGKWRNRAAKMLRAELHLRSSKSLRTRMKKHHGFKVEMEAMDAEADVRHRMLQLGLARFATAAPGGRKKPSISNKPQLQKPATP